MGMTDKQDRLNEAEVDFLLAGAEDNATVEDTSLDDGNQTVTMHGDLDQICLADIFQTLAMSKMEGVLRVRNPLEERQIFCHGGSVRILVPNRLMQRRLGQRLLQAGLLRPENLRSALVEQRQAKIPLGQLLVRDQLITQEALDDIVDMQVAEDLFSLFTWRHGTFEFFKGSLNNEVLRAQFELYPEYEVNSLLLEVARRSDEWQSILDALSSLDEVPQQVAKPVNPEQLDDGHIAVLESLDAKSTYRQLADQTTIGLFAYSRAARDLVNSGTISIVDDRSLIAIAHELADEGEQKRAIVLLQTLRDRDGSRSIDVIRGMAEVLELVGERRFASSLLLEAAKRSVLADEALNLARTARKLAPYDPDTLSFLRKTLVAHSPPESTELEKCTLDLVDALIDGNMIPAAREILDEAHWNSAAKPQFLMRQARAMQAANDIEGAAATLMQLATIHLSEGNRQQAVDAYKTIQRLDRSRKDVQKILSTLQRTRVGKLIRLASMFAVTVMIGGMGLIWWQQGALETSIATATSEVKQLLAQGDRTNARAKITTWREQLGQCDAIDELARLVTNADAAEKNRLAKVRRGRLTESFTRAAAAIGEGELIDALSIYRSMHCERGSQAEVTQVVTTRMDALVSELVRASKMLRNHMPAKPDRLFDRTEVTSNLATLQQACSPSLMRCFDQLSELSAQSNLPEFLTNATKTNIATALESARPDIEACRLLSQAYTKALERNDTQRRLDPMFKAAVEREARHDFAGAMKLYRELEAQPNDDVKLRTHFSNRAAHNATITRLLAELDKATSAGNFDTAHKILRELRASSPEVPFDALVRLPLTVSSQPPNAEVLVNGKTVGTTPLLLSRVPADKTSITVAIEGFAPAVREYAGDREAEWNAQLSLLPEATWQHHSALETGPAFTPDQHRVFVDRSGQIHKLTAQLSDTAWTFKSDDLSGWLTTPLLDQNRVIVASLDGKLRAININDGKLAWSIDNLPTEVHPVIIGRSLVLATNNSRLHTIDLDERSVQSSDMGQSAYGKLLATRHNAIAIGEGGLVTCYTIPDMQTVWQHNTKTLQSPHAAHNDKVIVVGDDQGLLVALDIQTGVVKWSRDLRKAVLGNIALDNDTVVVVAQNEIHRIQADTGKDIAGFACQSQNWSGEATITGARMIIPRKSGGMQVLDSMTGKHLYLLPGDSGSRVFATNGQVFVTSTDHKARSYGRLR
jgi:outer membrane protein assembly factor BamB/tetratricopeptide (TPR) repeat protein